MIRIATRIRCHAFTEMIRLRWAFLIAVLWIFASASAATAEPKRVLLLHSFGRDFSPWSVVAKSLRTELERQSPESIEFFDASLMTERFGADQDEGPFVDYLRALFAKRRLDLIVTIGSPGARFVQRYRSQLFPSTPMLFTGVDEQRVSLTTLTSNDTVVAISNDFDAVVKNILHVLPEATDVAIVIGNSPIEQYGLERIRSEVRPRTNVTLTSFNDMSFDEMLKRAAALPPNSAIFYVFLSVDAAGVSHEGEKALASLRSVANAPIFTSFDVSFGHGIIGGPLISAEDVARQAASVGMRILGGETPGDIKTPPMRHGTPKFDWRELQRWNISESRLPPGSEIHFRPQSMWQQYRAQMIVILSVLLLQAGMISALLLERHRRRAAELVSRGRLLEVLHLNRTATAGLLSASFAHEIAQPLASILSNTEAAELYLEQDPPDVGVVKEILADIRRDDQRADEIIRHLGGLLRKKGPRELEVFDVNDVVRDALHLLEPEAKRRGVALSAAQAPAALPVRADPIHLQQVILNLAANGLDAMANCAPGTRKLVLQSTLINASAAEVSVADTGTGIPSDKLTDVFKPFFTTKEHGTGIGLSISEAILQIYGGTIRAEHRPGGGTVFRFTVPLERIQAV